MRSLEYSPSIASNISTGNREVRFIVHHNILHLNHFRYNLFTPFYAPSFVLVSTVELSCGKIQHGTLATPSQQFGNSRSTSSEFSLTYSNVVIEMFAQLQLFQPGHCSVMTSISSSLSRRSTHLHLCIDILFVQKRHNRNVEK